MPAKNVFLSYSLIPSDVHKWIDANGKTHYGDAPPLASTTKIATDRQPDEPTAQKFRSENDYKKASAAHEARCSELIEKLKNTSVNFETSFTEIAAKKQQQKALTLEYESNCAVSLAV